MPGTYESSSTSLKALCCIRIRMSKLNDGTKLCSFETKRVKGVTFKILQSQFILSNCSKCSANVMWQSTEKIDLLEFRICDYAFGVELCF